VTKLVELSKLEENRPTARPDMIRAAKDFENYMGFLHNKMGFVAIGQDSLHVYIRQAEDLFRLRFHCPASWNDISIVWHWDVGEIKAQ
jgi:hypothetical protein